MIIKIAEITGRLKLDIIYPVPLKMPGKSMSEGWKEGKKGKGRRDRGKESSFHINYFSKIIKHKWSESGSVMSDSLRPHGQCSPWNSLGQILEWVAFPFSKGSSKPRDQTQVSHNAGRQFTLWATSEAQSKANFSKSCLPFANKVIPFKVSYPLPIYYM